MNPAGTVSVLFDAYESRRTSPAGLFLNGDANGDGRLSVRDIVEALREVTGAAFATGTPDCNLDGAISLFDTLCIQNAILSDEITAKALKLVAKGFEIIFKDSFE